MKFNMIVRCPEDAGETPTAGPNVTYVGGRAVEQHESGSSDLDSETRSKAAAAVKAAMEEAEKVGKESAEDDLETRVKDPTGTERYKRKAKELEEKESSGDSDLKTPKTEKEVVHKERDETGKFKAKEPAKPKEEPEEEKIDLSTSTVKQLLKNRDKLAALKQETKAAQEANDAVARQRQEAEEQVRKVNEVWQQIQAREAQLKAREEQLQRLASDPANAVRNLGYDPEDFVMRLAQEGTPEGRARRQQEEIQRRLQAQEDMWRQQQAMQQQWQQQQAQELRNRARLEVVKQFTAEAFGKDESGSEKYPHVAAFYDDDHDGLMGVADRAAFHFRKITGGREASFSDLLDYIEDGLATKIGKRYVLNSSKKAQATANVGVDTPTGKGRSISSDEMVGERRSASPKTSLKDLDADERQAAAKAAVKAALAAHK